MNPRMLKSFSYLAFTLSAIFTMILMTSAVIGIVATTLTIGMALMLEVCKVGFFSEGITNIKLNFGVRVTMIVISVMLLVASIVASAGYIQNMTNKTKNLELKHSTAFREAEDGKNIQKDLYENKKQEIESLAINYDSRINEMSKVRDDYPSNFFTRKENLQKEINQLAIEKQNILSQKNKELLELGQRLEIPIDVSNLQVNKTTGYGAFFEMIAKHINKDTYMREIPITAAEIELWFFMGLSIIFEFIAIITMYLSKVSLGQATPNPSNKIKPNTYQNENIKPKQTTIIKPNNKVISLEKPNRSLSLKGFNNLKPNKTPKSFGSEDVQKYLEYMYKTAKESKGELVSEGYIKISKNIGLTQETCRKIKAWLEQEGTIKSDGTKTIILDLNKTQVG